MWLNEGLPLDLWPLPVTASCPLPHSKQHYSTPESVPANPRRSWGDCVLSLGLLCALGYLPSALWA